jgi:tetratricopeptide (TPR) repeat protein
MNRKITFLAVFSLSLWGLTLEAQTPKQKNKEKISREVYNKIANTIKDTRKQPTFNFLFNEPDPYLNAYYDPSNNTINLGEGIYDIATTFGKDSLNALALVLGHELAHFYKDHTWGYDFATKNVYLKISEKIYTVNESESRKAEMETQADYYGGLFGYMAGYNTLSVGGAFFEKFYHKADVPDETYGYPTLQERMKICETSANMLSKMIPMFDAANYLVLIGEYEKAGNIYDNILATFPSREIYNNAGAAYAFAALSLFEEGELKYIYPFSLETDTRMNKGGQKGLSEDKVAKRKELLENAKQMFESACRLDRDYAPAYVNMGLAYALLDEKELGLAMAGKGYSMAEKNLDMLMMANACIARGIIYAMDGKKDEAKAEFTKALKGNKNVAQMNLNALLGTGTFGYMYKTDDATEKPSNKEESINTIDASLLEAVLGDAEMTEIKKQNDEKPKMKILSKSDALVTAVQLTAYTYPRQQVSFLFTGYNYDGASGRGIKRGMPLAKVTEQYGKAGRIVTGTSRNFYIYQKTPIIFITDKNDNVMGWVLYIK